MTGRIRRRAGYGAIGVLVGCALGGSPRQLSDSPAGAFEVSLAAADGRVVAAWHDTRHGNAEIYARTLDSATEHRLTSTAAESYVPDVAWIDSDIVVAWLEKSADNEEAAWIGRWSADGRTVWQRQLAADARRSRSPIVLVEHDRLFAAWIELDATDRGRVVGEWLTASGEPAGIPLRLGNASSDTWNLNGVIIGANRVLVAYDSSASTRASELYLADSNATRTVTRRLTDDDGFDSKYPDLATVPNGVLLSWQDARDGNVEVYAIAGPISSLAVPVDRRATRITASPGQSIGAYLATSAERAALVWCDDSDGDFEVFVQHLTLGGAVLGRAERLTRGPSDALIPAIVAVDDGFGIAWNEITRGPAGYHDGTTRSAVLYRVVP